MGADAGAVYPWETGDSEAKVCVSICPWEDETASPSTPTKRYEIFMLPARRLRLHILIFLYSILSNSNTPAVETRNSSSDISDISERLRKSCGVRQNTLDPDMFSNQRLAPVNYQQRRASITTMSPR